MPKHHEEKKAHKKGAGLKLIGSPDEIIDILIDAPEENKWALNQIINEGPEHKQVHSALLLKRMYKLVQSVEKISGNSFSSQKGNEVISEEYEHGKAIPVQIPFSVVSRDRAGEVLKVLSHAPEHELITFAALSQAIEWNIKTLAEKIKKIADSHE
jgi:hypothetical protein